MDMMPAMPQAIANPGNSIVSSGVKPEASGAFESLMAEITGGGSSENIINQLSALFPGLKISGENSPDAAGSILADDIDTQETEGESICAAFFAAFFQNETKPIASNPVDGEISAAMPGSRDQAGARAGIPAYQAQAESAVLTGVLPSADDGDAASLVTAETHKANGKALENTLASDVEPALLEKAPGLLKTDAQAVASREAAAVKDLSPEDGFENSSPAFTAEGEMAEAVGEVAGRQSPKSEGSSLDAAMTDISSSLGNSSKVETVGKEFTNVREGVEFLRLPSGELVDKNSVVDQLIQRVSLRDAQEGKTLSMRLHPQELGELKLEMVLENDKIRVNIQAQTHMVRDVLEQHLPQLRSALEAQGLRVGEMQLSLDSQQQSGSEFLENSSFGQENSQQHFNRSFQTGNGRDRSAMETLPGKDMGIIANVPRSGLSLRI